MIRDPLSPLKAACALLICGALLSACGSSSSPPPTPIVRTNLLSIMPESECRMPTLIGPPAGSAAGVGLGAADATLAAADSMGFAGSDCLASSLQPADASWQAAATPTNRSSEANIS